MADGKVTINTQLDNSGLKKGINGISGSFGGLKSVLGKIGAAVGAAFAVKQLVDFGKAAVELGSNVAEVQNVVDVAFGDMAYKIEAFADASIENYGMSRLSAKKTASTYMAMARGMGIAEEQASDMAIALTGLTGDVASFYNITQEEADTKLKSVFTGETETLKDLGVVMTQANLDAYALAKGIGRTTAQMNQQELVALRYRYVMEQLSLAQGDFARTSDSWANQTRILSEKWKEFMSIVGQALITVLTPVVKVLNSIVSGLIEMANAFNAAISAIFGGAATQIEQTQSAAAGVGAAISSGVEEQQALTEATKETVKAQNALGIDELNVVSQSAAGGSGTGGGGVSAGTSGLTQVTQEAAGISPMLDGVRKALEKLGALFAPSLKAWGDAFKNLKKPAQEAMSTIKNAASDLWKNGLAPLGSYLLGDFVPTVTNAFSENLAPVFSDVLGYGMQQAALDFETACWTVTNLINDLVLPIAETLKIAWVDVFNSIGSTWNRFGESLLEKWAAVREGARQIWQSVYESAIRPVLETLTAAIDWLWADHLKPLWDNILLFIASFSEAVSSILAALSPLVDYLVTVFGPLVASVFQSVIDIVGTVFAVILDVISGILRALAGVCEFLTGVFTLDWEKAWQGIKDIVGGVWDGIWGIIKGVINLIIDLINGMIRAIVGGINAVINTLNSISFDIPDWVPVFGGSHFGLNLGTITPPQIPKLAQGAVIPPNREFLAVLGDQKNGTNIEAPLDTIRQAVAMELAGNPQLEYLSRMVTLLQEILDKDESITIGDDVIGRAAARWQARRGVSVDSSEFADVY